MSSLLIEEETVNKGAKLAPSFDAETKDFKTWREFFHENGYVVLSNALSKEQVEKLRADLKVANTQEMAKQRSKAKSRGKHGEADHEENMSRRHVMHTVPYLSLQ